MQCGGPTVCKIFSNTVWFKINLTLFKSHISQTRGGIFKFYNIFQNHNVLVRNGEKGSEIIIQIKTPVFINIVKNGFTHMKICGNIAILSCFRCLQALFLAIFSLTRLPCLYFSFVFNAIFAI